MATQKEHKKLVFNTNYRLMQVKNIAECSKGSILQYFRPSLSYHFPLIPLFCLFLVAASDRFYCTSEFFHIRWYDAISCGWSLYTSRCHGLAIPNKDIFHSLKFVINLANSADPDEMPLSVAFHLGLHCLPSTHLGVSSMQRIKLSSKKWHLCNYIEQNIL